MPDVITIDRPCPRRRRAAALALLLAAATSATAVTACSRPANGSTDPAAQAHQQQPVVAAALGTPFELRIGQSADVGGAGLRATLVSVADDSRCPSDVQCVWAGDAEVSVRLERAGRAATAQLHITPRAGVLREVEYDGYVVRLESLAPTPRAGHQILDADYVATLTVRAK